MKTANRFNNSRVVRAARGPEISAKSWLTEAPMRMLMNNLDPDVAESPKSLLSMAALAVPRGTGILSTALCTHSNAWKITRLCWFNRANP
jgi:hypothetical protein